MLQNIRDKIVGWVIWVVLLLVGVPFAFWGVDSFFLGGGDPVVAKVGSQKIYQSQFRASYENRYQQLQQMMGENFRADMFDKGRFQKAVLDDMTQEAMMRQYTHDAGYRANDAALFEYLSTVPVFQKDGKFDSVAYQEALARQGMTPTKFESQLRNSMEIDQLRGAVTDTAFVTGPEAEQADRLQHQERWLSYVSFEAGKYRDKITLTPEQIKAKYESSKAAYMAPERVKLAYVELALDSVPKADAPKQDVLKVMYDAEKDSRYTTPEQRKARHILVNFGADKEAAKKKIEGIAAELKSGKDFSDLAKARSDDPGSKGAGGDLGWVRRGQMVKPFEDALFSMKAGELSGPVESQFGWHLIKLDELKPQQTRPFADAEVQHQLIELYQTREAQKHFQELQEKLEQSAFEQSASLDGVAKDLGLQVQTTDWFPRAGGSGIAANNAVKQAAFSPEIIKDNENSKPIPVGDNKVVVIRKAEYEAPRQRPLEEVTAEIQAALTDELSRAQAAADADLVLKTAQGGKAFADAAREKGAEPVSPGLVKRDNAGIDRAVLDALFKLPRPRQGGASYGKAQLASGNVVVLALSAVQDPPAGGGDAARSRAQLRDLRAGAEFNGYRKAVEQKVKVRIVNPPQVEEAPKPE